jgi:hypothetical protein
MVEIIIGATLVVALILGFWFTRGGGGVPGGIDDPAREELERHSALGYRLPDAAEEDPESREHHAE